MSLTVSAMRERDERTLSVWTCRLSLSFEQRTLVSLPPSSTIFRVFSIILSSSLSRNSSSSSIGAVGGRFISFSPLSIEIKGICNKHFPCRMEKEGGTAFVKIERLVFVSPPCVFKVKIKHNAVHYKTGVIERKTGSHEENVFVFGSIQEKHSAFPITFHDYVFSEIRIEVFDCSGFFGKSVFGAGRIRVEKINIDRKSEVELVSHSGRRLGSALLDVFVEETQTGPADSPALRTGANVISGVEMQIIDRVKAVFSEFRHEKGVSTFVLFLGYVLLRRFQKKERKKRAQLGTSIEIKNKKEIGRSLDAAIAAYGWKGVFTCDRGVSPLSSVFHRGDSDRIAAAKYLGIMPEDFFVFRLDRCEVYRPKYFIFHDREANAVVISVRGTMDGKDLLTDLTFHYTKWMEGYVHGGILLCAESIYEEIRGDIFSQCLSHGATELRVVGHSLGGGVASLLAVLLIKRSRGGDTGGVKIHCQTFGAAACVSEELLERYSQYIEAFVYRSDVVPTISFGSFLDLGTLLFKTGEAASFMSLFRKLSPKTEEQISSTQREIRAENRRKLFVLGTVYRIERDRTSRRAFAVHTDPNEFHEIQVSGRAFKDHMPHVYKKMFDRFLRDDGC
ncbi:MAG: uncharacterized protein A8A55_0471 [Amphiamblys sp. WSBS2006]|nr:MAG: uncharacterized protein A8A55_0471 [Amphiamblys sp. WSBS2006]